jgi:CRP/FNR family transcriptional regulator
MINPEQQVISGIVREFQPGTLLYSSEQKIIGLWRVIEGVLRIVADDEAGHELTLFRIMPGQWLCHDYLFQSPVRHLPCRIIAERYSKIEYFEQNILQQQGQTDPSTVWQLVQSLQNQIHAVMDLAAELAFNSVEQRLFSWLALKCISGTRRITITHQELANHLGTSREVISRILKDWEVKQAVSLSRGTIRLEESFRTMVI